MQKVLGAIVDHKLPLDDDSFPLIRDALFVLASKVSNVCACTHMSVCACVRACMHACVHMRICVFMCMLVCCVYTHIIMYTYMKMYSLLCKYFCYVNTDQ